MKKIYSLLLTAAALLVGTNAWAGTYNVGTIEDFETYWAKSATEDVVINLTSNSITLTKTMWLGTQALNGTPHSVTINMNGHQLTSNASGNSFLLTHGTLKITGNGDITSSSTTVFFVTGSTNKDVNPKAENVNYFSHLEIDEGVRIIHTAYAAAISIDQMHSGSTAYKAIANSVPTKPALGYITNVYAQKEAGTKGVANGVRIDLKGNIEARKYGIKTNGDLGNPNWYEQQTWKKTDHTIAFSSTLVPEGYVIAESDTAYCPYVRIHPTARIKVSTHDDEHSNPADYKNPIAIYASGYARWLVEGYAEGCTGATIKSGVVDFTDATVVGTGDTYTSASETTSGSTASGSAIVIVTSEAYAGDIDINIGGDSYVAASNGFAIEEQVVASNNETKVDSLTITGGTFQGGQIPDPVDPTQGNIDAVMSVSVPTAVAAANTEEETTITIIGGTSNTGSATIGTQTLADYLSDTQESSTHLTEVSTGTGTIWVISEGAAPTDAEDLKLKEWPEGAEASVNWIHANELVTTAMKDSIDVLNMAYHGDKTTFQLRELQMSGNYDQTLIIKDGYTLQVGRVILGAKAKIVVEAGAKLIITGAQGVVAPKEGNIVLKYDSENGKYANVLFNNAVSSNRHPNATVEFTSDSWRESSTSLQWEWFGIPTFTAAKSIASTCPAFVCVYENNDWSDIGLISDINDDADKLAKLNKPFAAYDLLANRKQDQAAPVITITGELVGNVDATLRADKRWNPFANSYTAEIDAEKLVTALSSSENIAAAVYVATQNNDGSITWDAKYLEPLNKVHGIMLRPMQAFMLNNNRYVEDATINYASMVYAPAVPSPAPAQDPAPRRSAENENATIVTINVANENGTWDDVDLCESNAASFEKYLNSDINIYVLAEEKSDCFAAEDIENTYVGFSTVKGGNFTISFTKAEGREFDLIDLETGAKVAVAEGETYSFSAAANFANDYRFKLVERAKMPTAIENTEVKANVKGIYTITGQYLGEMNVWNTLPAGVYVVNGAKLVK